MFVTLSGIVIDVKPEQLLNASMPILVIPLPIITFFTFSLGSVLYSDISPLPLIVSVPSSSSSQVMFLYVPIFSIAADAVIKEQER